MAETLNAEVSRASETGESVRRRVKCTTPDFPPIRGRRAFAGRGWWREPHLCEACLHILREPHSDAEVVHWHTVHSSSVGTSYCRENVLLCMVFAPSLAECVMRVHDCGSFCTDCLQLPESAYIVQKE